MADAITTPEDGQSIPAALAAKPESRKPRVKASKAIKPVRPAAIAPAPPEPVAPVIDSVAEATEAAADATEAAADATETVVAAVSPEPTVEAAAQVVTAPVEAIAPITTPPAAVPAEPQKESSMATTIENVTGNTTAKAQAFFADAGERTKGAVAKSTKLFEDATAFGKGNVEALVESSKIAAKGFETMGQDAAEFGRKSFEDATAAFKTLATVKSPTEFLKLQSDFVRQSFDSLVAETSRSTESVLKLAGEVAQPISNRIAVAAEKLKPAA